MYEHSLLFHKSNLSACLKLREGHLQKSGKLIGWGETTFLNVISCPQKFIKNVAQRIRTHLYTRSPELLAISKAADFQLHFQSPNLKVIMTRVCGPTWGHQSRVRGKSHLIAVG